MLISGLNRSLRGGRWLLLPCLLSACAVSTSQKTTSAGADAWVEETLAGLTLREKVGQMMMPWVSGNYVATDTEDFDTLAAWVERDGVGGLVMSVGMPHSYAAKLNALQRRARVPLLIASDMENGPGMRMGGIYSFPHLIAQDGGTEFPSTMAIGATDSDSLAYGLGRATAREARAVGVHMVFGPVLDVNSNPANPIINTRSFGEQPDQVARLALAYIRGAHDGGLLTTGKHFPGHGDTETDSHIDLPTISADRARLDSVELAPFRAAIDQDIDAIMTAHIAVTGVEGAQAPPATLSRFIMNDLLREQLHFRGLLITDAMSMGAVVRRYGEQDAVLQALNAGADIILMPVSLQRAIATVVEAVESGRVPEARIDASVRRILQAKVESGVTRNRFVSLDSVTNNVGIRAHRDLAENIAQRSITLARAAAGQVPLPDSARRILSVTYVGVQDPVAGRAFDMALRASGRQVRPRRVDARTTVPEFEALLAEADSADATIISMYISPVEAAGTIQAENAITSFVRQLSAKGKPVVGVSFGSPYVINALPDVSAYLLAWSGVPVSQRAAARALLGVAPITGKLPVSIPPHFTRGDGLERVLP
jgi:beta-N-acetylhexosaminidase